MTTKNIKSSALFGVGYLEYFPVYETTIDKLANILPHGSGINNDWYIMQQNTNHKIYYAKNAYHAMDQYGGYCHIYDFTAKYQFNLSSIKVCKYCNGVGIRFIREFADKHFNGDYIATIDRIIGGLHHGFTLLWSDFNGEIKDYIICNVCHGEGYTRIPDFTLLDINFHSQKERNCCGYGLKDYLFDTLSL